MGNATIASTNRQPLSVKWPVSSVKLLRDILKHGAVLSETSGPMLRCKEAAGPAPHTGSVDDASQPIVASQIRTTVSAGTGPTGC